MIDRSEGLPQMCRTVLADLQKQVRQTPALLAVQPVEPLAKSIPNCCSHENREKMWNVTVPRAIPMAEPATTSLRKCMPRMMRELAMRNAAVTR